ncbi:hypothetical protein J4411_00895 [Candidatus Pacearchaeota archaeon]|nr:hypothetical protein [uncultured archaeon]MBS3084452.1 hypothetical protein [Candidatus Pacearchaeota archaeon]
MVRESLYVLFLMSEFSGISSRLILDFPVTSKSQKVPYMESLCYPPKNPLRKTFFPAYAKTSKLTYANRYGRHINLERRVKGGKSLKWK